MAAEKCIWDRVPADIPAGRVTLATRISMVRPSMADGRLQVPSSATRCIHLATAPGGEALVNSTLVKDYDRAHHFHR